MGKVLDPVVCPSPDRPEWHCVGDLVQSGVCQSRGMIVLASKRAECSTCPILYHCEQVDRDLVCLVGIHEYFCRFLKIILAYVYVFGFGLNSIQSSSLWVDSLDLKDTSTYRDFFPFCRLKGIVSTLNLRKVTTRYVDSKGIFSFLSTQRTSTQRELDCTEKKECSDHSRDGASDTRIYTTKETLNVLKGFEAIYKELQCSLFLHIL